MNDELNQAEESIEVDQQEASTEGEVDSSIVVESDVSEAIDDVVDDSSVPQDFPDFEPDFHDDILSDYVRRAIAPINGGHPCGESEEPASSVVSQIETTGDGIHESLRLAFGDAIRDDSPASFEMSSAGRDADGLIDQIVDCLAEKCKSIVLASYLPHLMLIMYGPEGFDAGLTVVRELTLRYGSDAFPRDNDRLGSFLRRGVYIGNDDKVTDNYKLFLYTPITEPENLPYALLRNSRLKGAGSSVEGRYAADASRSSVDFYVKLVGSMERSIDRAREANLALGELLGDTTFEIVSYSFLESMERMTSMIRNLATENCAGYPPVEDDAQPTEEVQATAGVAAAAPIATGEIVDRDQAIKMLGKIADFFYKTERHSPISYRIRDTIRWCKMDFPELLQLLLDGDENSLTEMRKRVGFDDPDDGDSDDE